MSKYETERNRIYTEVHDDKSRMLDAALIDIEDMTVRLAALTEANKKLRAEKAVRDTPLVIPDQLQFAKDLTTLCKKYAMSVVAGSCEVEGLLLLEGPLHPAESFVLVSHHEHGGFIELIVKEVLE